MARKATKLTAVEVKQARHSGNTPHEERLYDEYGLMLRLQPNDAGKSWMQRLTLKPRNGAKQGKRIVIGLGRFPVVTLAEARATAMENYAAAKRTGEHPRKTRASAPDFRAVERMVYAVNVKAWKGGDNGHSAKQWRTTMADYVFPVLGELAVDAIATADVLRLLTPIWDAKPVTAKRVRQWTSQVMRRAKAEGWREDDPADKAVLQALPKLREATKHREALPYAVVGDFARKLYASPRWAGFKLALELVMLTATRSGEVAKATWNEVDLEAKTWTIPAERMKAGKEHRVPLSPRCVAILREAEALSGATRNAGSRLVFRQRKGNAIHEQQLNRLMKEVCAEVGAKGTVHGFRSTFRDWAGEQSGAEHAVMEAALAHAIPNAAEAAYARSDLFDKRRKLMADWAAFAAA